MIDPTDDVLLPIGQWLRAQNYEFTTPTPATIERVNRRPENARATSLRDVFGWNRPFEPSLLPAQIRRLLEQADLLAHGGPLLRSRVRFASLDEQLYVHSEYPTVEPDAVFFGPDTYRFVRHARTIVKNKGLAPESIIDVCCGSGAGGLSLLEHFDKRPALILSDINANALRFASVNARLNSMDGVALRQTNLFDGLPKADLIIANPPYLMDSRLRKYRHGGDDHGTELSLRIAREGAAQLAPGGHLIIYTGSPILAGHDEFRSKLEALSGRDLMSITYEEIDPDVFGEELDQPLYGEVERIALVAVLISHR